MENRLPKYILTAEEAEQVLQQPDITTPEGLRDRAILETFYATGMRRMEVANLKLYDIDADRGAVMIRQGKGKKDRYIPISERALAWIGKNAGPQVGSVGYGSAGQITSLGYFGVTETRQYNSLLQMTSQQVPGMMDMQYAFDTSGHNNGRIRKSIDGIVGETVNYTYDPWNRLTLAETEGAGGWGQSFTYDGFGNMTAKSATKGTGVPTYNASINPATNGGPTSFPQTPPDGMDVENRPIAGPNGAYTYDQANKRVMVFKDGVAEAAIWEVAFYGIGGQRLLTAACHYSYYGSETMGCETPQYNVYFGGKLVKSRGTVVVTDRLGSVRANGNGERFAYYPYGEERKQTNGTWTADGREKFGTYLRDVGPASQGAGNWGQDYADQRYYGVGTGRFNVPDPSTGVDRLDPTSWNKYLYTQGDPVNFNDPKGLQRRAGRGWVCFYVNGMLDSCEMDWGDVDFAGGGGGGGGEGSGRPSPLPDPQDGGGYFKPKDPPPLLFGVKDVTKLFNAAWGSAWSDLNKPDCANAFLKSTSGLQQTFENATFQYFPAFVTDVNSPDYGKIDPSIDATANRATNTITINNSGNFVNYTGSTTITMQGQSATVTADQYRTYILLHELGHLAGLSNFPDSNNYDNTFNRNLLKDCIGVKFQ